MNTTTTNTTGSSTAGGERRSRGWLLWLPGLAVALGAIAATAHGLFEVAVTAGVPGGLAWLYPVMTDGLALVAYVSTIRLTETTDRAYAWIVVVLAAGLSGLAQAAYLAGGVGDVSPTLRFGVGAWPAVAAAIVAHLLFLIVRPNTEQEPREVDPRRVDADLSTRDLPPGQTTAVDAHVSTDAGQRPAGARVQADATVSNRAGGQVSKADRSTSGVQVSNPVGVQPAGLPAARVSNTSVSAAGSGARDRALAVARSRSVRHGSLPSVRELQRLAEVSRGTAASALKELREHPAHLHVVNDDSDDQEAAQQ